MLMADRYRCAQPIVNSTVLPGRYSIERALSLSIFRNCNAVMQPIDESVVVIYRRDGSKTVQSKPAGKGIIRSVEFFDRPKNIFRINGHWSEGKDRYW